jgi:hypothetical protein
MAEKSMKRCWPIQILLSLLIWRYVKNNVAEEKLGKIPQIAALFPVEPIGEAWDEENVNRLYPRLAAKYSIKDDRNGEGVNKKPWWKFW